ncbi:hypothetical protein [Enterobacter ludwigii]|uniref:hypothetical protein n=1 Tax=Enterobacter ludwigii TaxID=299767 RepID=UPI0013D15487|nr:hypothetical protein [Enterobacter ludwigii]
MSNFTIRVELHNADSDDYDVLHKNMEAKGYSREITANGKTYQLPSAEYVCTKNLTATEIRDEVLNIAKKVKPSPDVLVTKSDGRAWCLSQV